MEAIKQQKEMEQSLTCPKCKGEEFILVKSQISDYVIFAFCNKCKVFFNEHFSMLNNKTELTEFKK